MLQAGLIDLDELHPQEILIEDIAHSLAYTNRYNGQTVRPYSVAEHCIILSDFIEGNNAYCDDNPLYDKWVMYDNDSNYSEEELLNLQLALLLHDAQEAYIGDLVYPLKQELKEYYKIEDKIQKKIMDKFFPGGYEQYCSLYRVHVEEFDRTICIDEMYHLKDGFHDPGLDGYKMLNPKGLNILPGFWRAKDTPETIKESFLDRFNKLTSKLVAEGAYNNV